MAQIGNKKNSQLNGIWGRHVRGIYKKITSRKRRKEGEDFIAEELKEEVKANELNSLDDWQEFWHPNEEL